MSCLGVGLDNGYDDGAGQGPARIVPLFHLATTEGGLVGGFFLVIDHYMLVLYVTKEKTTGIVEKKLLMYLTRIRCNFSIFRQST